MSENLARSAESALAAPLSSEHDDADACESAGPLLTPGAPVAPGYRVVTHLRRGDRLDVYDLWSNARESRCVGKTLRPDRAEDEFAAGLLRTEGMLLTTLTHPHLVRGYATVLTSEPERPLVVSETLPGHTLSYLIDEHERLRPADAAVLGIQLCSVLGYLHRQGWVHLDVKPSNVVETGGRAVLLDLSLACRIGEHSSGGTFDYLAPEQARGDEMTASADVWGLGCTLYETLTGTTPWAHVSHRAKDESGNHRYPQLEGRATAVREHRRLPKGLAELVDSCLEPDPRTRPTVREVANQLVALSGADPMSPAET